MDNEDVVNGDNINNSASDSSVEDESVDNSGSSSDKNKTTYGNKGNVHNRFARDFDRRNRALQNLRKNMNGFGNKLNNFANKNPDSRLAKLAGGAGKKLNSFGNGLGKISDKTDEVNDAVQGANNVANAVEDPLGTAAGAAKDKFKEKTKDIAKEATDKAKVTIKKVGKKLIPIALSAGGILFLCLIILIVFAAVIIAVFGTDEDNSDESVVSGNGTCIYNVHGNQVTNLKVRLLNCEGKTPVSGEELIDFEDYITGVVYQEVGDAPLEALKVQAIVARSFSLTRPFRMGYNTNPEKNAMYNKYGLYLRQEGEQWVLGLRSCTNDQVFCNADKGCWSLRKGGQTSDSNPGDWPNCTVHSGDDSSKPWHRAPLSQNSKIRQAVEETKGVVLEDSKGEIVHTNFNNSNQTMWASMANKGKDVFEILTKDYGSGKKLSDANCTSASDDSTIDTNVSADVASIMKWDQKTAWKNLIGKSTSDTKPYVSNSEMNLRVTSVEVPMRRWKGSSGHNPSTDTHKVMQSITVNKALVPLWKAFFEDVYNNAPDFVIGSFDGCYVYRTVTGGGSLSAHAYGVACDINAGTKGNGYGTTSYTKSKWESLPNTREKYQVVYRGSKVVQIAHKYTLINGSDWSNGGNDAMHFSFIRDWTRDRLIACQGKVSCS